MSIHREPNSVDHGMEPSYTSLRRQGLNHRSLKVQHHRRPDQRCNTISDQDYISQSMFPQHIVDEQYRMPPGHRAGWSGHRRMLTATLRLFEEVSRHSNTVRIFESRILSGTYLMILTLPFRSISASSPMCRLTRAIAPGMLWSDRKLAGCALFG